MGGAPSLLEHSEFKLASNAPPGSSAGAPPGPSVEVVDALKQLMIDGRASFSPISTCGPSGGSTHFSSSGGLGY